jgi:hypothetical protein
MAHIEYEDDPIRRILADFAIAILDENENQKRRADWDRRERAVNIARLYAALAAWERIPVSEWDRWCEVPKHEFIAEYRANLVAAGMTLGRDC